MITHDQLIQFCQENDNKYNPLNSIELMERKDGLKFRITYDNVKDIEIFTILINWINPLKNDDISDSLYQIASFFRYNVLPYQYIESKEWERYKGNTMRVYKHYDMNGFYYLCRSIWYIYVKEKRESIEELFLNTNDKYYHETICRLFGGNSQIQNEKSVGSCANLNMMMKYLVHDLKRWKRIDKSKLLIPLTHKIIIAAHDLSIIKRTLNTLANAKRVTEFGKELLGDDFMKLYAGLVYYYHNHLKN
jgi:hypothetical protein